MQTIRFNNSVFAAMASLTLVMSCGIKQVEGTGSSTNAGRYNNDIYDDSGSSSDWQRLCSKPVLFTSVGALESGLEKYFFTTKYGVPAYPGEVRDLELPVNWCFKIASGGSRAAFRIEYEDHFGGGWYEMSASKSSNPSSASKAPILFHSEINTSTNVLDVIFLDSQGFTQITGPKVGDYYEATIRFANLPTESDYTNAQIASIKQKCQSGEWTVAKCLGYNMPSTFWWEDQNQNPSNNTLEMAREMLDGGGGAEAGTIGTMKFRLSDVLW